MANVHRTIPDLTQQDTDRFWFYVGIVTGDGCWLWWGYRDEEGYGVLQVQGQPYRAHRLSYLISNGEQPGHWVICHRCNNRRCVNPAHLYAGTPADNTRDAVEAGTLHVAYGDDHWTHKRPDRVAKGSRVGGSKLTAEQVLVIRADYSQGRANHRELAERFGITREAISRIIQRRNWKHLPD
jgi:hypothetical protein